MLGDWKLCDKGKEGYVHLLKIDFKVNLFLENILEKITIFIIIY